MIVMVMLMAMSFMIVVVMLVFMASALFMIMMVMLMAVVFMIVVVMLMLMTSALFVIMMVVLMAVVFMIVVVMFVFMASALFMIMMVMLMMMAANRAHLFFLHKLLCQRTRSLDCIQDLLSRQFLPGSGDNDAFGILFPDQFNRFHLLFLGHFLRSAENHGTGILDLIIIKFPEVSHIHLNFRDIRHSHKPIKLKSCLRRRIFHCPAHIGKLAYP